MELFAGRYQLLRSLGRGGMGSVWLALDRATLTECALKRLEAELPDAERDSLQREFQVLARLRHPSIVTVFELGFTPEGIPFYTMEFVPGTQAAEAVLPGNWSAWWSCAVDLSHALEVLHGAGVLHGDVKPSNVLVLRDARTGAFAGIKLLDLGLASLMGRPSRGRRGTRGYAAPEVVGGATSSVASDLYGLGATLYVMALRCAGNHGPKAAMPPADPFGAALVLEEAGVSEPVLRLLSRLLSPDPGSRPVDAREVRLELERLHPSARRTLTDRLRSEVFVGRSAELARIEGWLAASTQGPPLLFLSSPSGAGRTALLGEAGVRAALSGHPVVSLQLTHGAPAATVRAFLRRLSVEVGRLEGGERDVAWVRDWLRDDRSPLEPNLEELLRVAIGWGARFALGPRAPLITIDDAGLLDAASRTFFRRLALHPALGPIRWLWSSATTGGPGPPADRLLLDAGSAVQLTLEPLPREQADALLAARLRRTPPPELADALWERTGGHPGHLVQQLLAAAESDALSDGETGITFDRQRFARAPMSQEFEQACLTRLESLGRTASGVAAALAVHGGSLRPAELRIMDPGASDEVLARLDGAGFLARDESGRSALRPPGLARLVLEGLTEEDRRALHRAALRVEGLSPLQRFEHRAGAGEPEAALVEARAALEAGAGLALVVPAAELASARGDAEAPEWEERAGRALLERGRYREAIPHLERSLQALSGERARGRRWHALSGALLRTGETTRLRELLAIALASSLAPRDRALLLTNESMLQSSAGDAARAEELAREALALASSADAAEAQSLAALTLGNLRLRAGLLEEAERLAELAEEAGARAGYALGRLRGTGLRALVAGQRREPETAERLYRTALAEARELGARLVQFELSSNLAFLLMETGRWTESREAMAESLRVALEEGWPAAAAFGLVNLTTIDIYGGRVSNAVRRARAALKLVRQHDRSIEPYAWRSLATALRVTGRLRAALRAARRALRLAEAGATAAERAWCRLEYGTACARAGRWPEAANVAEMGLRTAPGDDTSVPQLLSLSGRAALRKGDLERAEVALSAADRWCAGRVAPYAAASVQQLRAELLLARARAVEGERAVAATLASFATFPAPADVAAAALEFARVATRAGIASRTPVPEWLRQAAAGFERLGDHAQRERALARAVDWYRRHAEHGPVGAHDRNLLEAVTRLLDLQPDLDELARRAMQLAVDQLDAERGVLVLASDDAGELRPVVEYGAMDASTRDQALTYSREAVERVATSGGSLLMADTATESETLSKSMVELGLRSILCVPMFVAGKVVGAVYLDDSRRAEAFGDAERGLLEGFAHLMAVAIENRRGHDRVRRANEELLGENLSLRRVAGARFQPSNFVARSLVMQRVLGVAERAASLSSTVLITGENGTGKEQVARMLHYSGSRSLKPFVAVNCGAIPETLLESELFGILPDVATGVRARAGRFVEAHQGTLFLDEIGEMPPSQQVALLGVLSNRKLTPVGGGRPVDVDVRVIAATNADLAKLVSEGRFRQDLYYRLNVVPLELPPLRERKADIPALAHHFAEQIAAQQGRKLPQLAPSLLAVLMQSDWPGNVRELQNYIERLMALTRGDVLLPDPPPDDMQREGSPRNRPGRARSLRDHVAEIVKRRVLEALERHQGNQSQAARELGLTEQAMRYRLRKYSPSSARRSRRVR